MAEYKWAIKEKLQELLQRLDDEYTNWLWGETRDQVINSAGIKGVTEKFLVFSGATQVQRLFAYIAGLPVPTAGETASQYWAASVATFQLPGQIGINQPAYPAGVLTVPLKKLVTAVAPLFGFSVDNEAFFRTNEWYALRDACVQYLWDGTDVAPVIISNAYKAYANADLVDRIGQEFNTWQDPRNWIIPYDSIPSTYTLFYKYYNSGLIMSAGDDFIYRDSRFPNTISRIWATSGCKFGVYRTSNNHYFFPTISDNSGRFCVNVSTDGTIPERDVDTAWGATLGPTESLSELNTPCGLKYGNIYLQTSTYAAQYVGEILSHPYINDFTKVNFDSNDTISLFNETQDLIACYSAASLPAGVHAWTGNSPSATWFEDNVYVYYYADGTVKYVHIYIDPLPRNETWNPADQPNPQAPTPLNNVTPYVPTYNTPLPTVVPDPSPTAPGSNIDNPADPVDDGTIDWWKNYDNTIISPPEIPPTDPTPASPLPSGYEGTSGASGMIHVYRPSNQAFNDFAAWLWVKWSDVGGVPRFWNNPIDGIISAHELYYNPTIGQAEFIRSGFLESTVSAPIVTARYGNVSCGSISVPEFYGNYTDYSPYSTAMIYLPFIGIVNLDIDDIVGSEVEVRYVVDTYTGACLAQILCRRESTQYRKLYEFNGNCAVTVPLSGGTQAQIAVGLINAAGQALNGVGSIVDGIISGNLGGVSVGDVLGGLGGIAQGAAQALSPKSSVTHSGSFASNYGAMGSKIPYLIIRRPILVNATNYNLEYGYPAHKRVTIGACTGYLRVREVNVVSATATNEEKARIESLLKGGVYVT